MATFSEEKLHQKRPLDATFLKSCCGDCEAFDPLGCGGNYANRKFRDRPGYCLWTPAKGKMMTTYESNVPCSKFVPKKGVMVAIGK